MIYNFLKTKIKHPKIFIYKKTNMFFLYYILVVLVTLTIVMPVYFYSKDVVRYNIISESRYYMDKGVALLSSTLSNMKNNSYNQIKKNADVIKIRKTDTLKTNDYYILTKISDSLKSAIPISDLIKLSFVYFANNDVLITSNQIYHNSDFIREKNFMEILKSNNKNVIYEKNIDLLGIQYTGVSLIYLNDSFMNNYDNSFKVGALLSMDYIVDIIMSNKLKQHGWLYIEDSDNNIVFDYNYDDLPVSNISSVTDEATINGKKNAVFTAFLPELNLKLVTGIQYNYLDIETNSILQTIRLIFAIALLFGIIISVILSWAANKPINKLVDKLQLSGVINEGPANNFELINTALMNILRERDTLWDEMKIYQNQALTGLIDRFIHNSVMNNDEIKTLNNYYKDVINDYRVVMVSLQGMKVSDSDVIIKNEELRLICILVCESINKHFSSSIKPIEKNPFCFISVIKNDEINSLVSSCKKLNDNIFAQLGIKTKIALSSAHGSIFEMYISVKECEYMLSLSNYSGEIVSVYDKLSFIDNIYIFDFSTAQRIFQLLIAGEGENARLLIDEFFTAHFKSKNDEIIQAYYTFKTIIASVYKEFGKEYTGRMSIALTDKNQVYEYICDEIVEICKLSSERVITKTDNNKLMVVNYIAENISDCMLCISSVATHFSLSEKYISIIVKEKTGSSFSAFIEKLRMDNSVELLKNTNLTIQQISENCGYSSQNSFYKAFKRNFNMSPSTFREGQTLLNIKK